VRAALPQGYPVERDFSPPYKPWDQRLCLVPDGDLFAVISSGKASVATSAVERFTADGLRMASGEDVRADVIVTATGLNLQLFGGMRLEIDGERLNPAERLLYKGMMLGGVPNLVLSFGYVNASWTLRSDLTARSFCRLLNHMRAKGYAICTPRPPAGRLGRRPLLGFSSAYVTRSLSILPQQGDRHPWFVPQNYVRDRLAMRLRPLTEDLQLTRNDTAARA
jgi:cation diffusion facilitator CzcD-associated flavoprotein CzcO